MDLSEWLRTLARELGVADVALDEQAVQILLDLARDCAHEVERVAAPLSTYLLGVAVGRGAELEPSATAITQLLLPDAPPPVAE